MCKRSFVYPLREICLAFLPIILSLTVAQMVHSQNAGAVEPIPDHEKRSCIQAVDGYAYLSEKIGLEGVRAQAFANAKRQALEMARTYIRSKTMVEDFELKYDMIWAAAEGAVTILEQRDHGVEDNTRYHVWIKAEVEYGLRPKGELLFPEDHAPDMDTGLPLKVKVWTSKKEYRDGESIEIYIQGNRGFYARIVDITSSGEIIQLLPNDYRRINFFKAGKVYKIPDQGDHFDLKVTAPYGEEQIVVYASEVPLGHVPMEPVGEGLSRYSASRKSLATMTRGINIVSGDPGSISGAEFYETTWTLITRR